MKQLHLFEFPAHTIESYQLFVDGAARGNPGPAGAGVYCVSGGQVVAEYGYYLGIKTNNQAEYLALLLGIFHLVQKMQRGDELIVYSDSQLMVRQMMGMYKIADPILKTYADAAKKVLYDYQVTYVHVEREHNKKADLLANRGVDTKTKVPSTFFDFYSLKPCM